MFEVVQVEQRPGADQRVGDAVDQRLARRLADTERLGDGRRHELRVGDRGEADEVHRPFDCRPRCNLEGKPALPSTTRPGDRDEPNVLAGKQARDLRQIALSADKPMVQSGKGRPAQGLQRRKRLCQAHTDDLKDRLRARNVLEPVATERAERQPCERLSATSSRTACDTITCPPCAAEQSRAAICTSTPT